MKKWIVDKEMVIAAALGGAVLAGGEGGSFEYGEKLGYLALDLGRPYMVDLDDLADDSILLCVSIVGSPATKGRYLEPTYHIRAVEKFIQYSGMKIDGIITNGNGATSSINGWLQSVALGIPFVDALCNGRNSPASVYGSMGLHLVDDYEAIQMGIGGDPLLGNYIEIYTKGTLLKTTNVIRQGAVEAGGGIAVARNPVTVAYAKENAAICGISKAISLGREIMRLQGDINATSKCICDFLKGEIVAKGKVSKFNLHTKSSLDCGLVSIADNGNRCTVNFVNQYMSLEKNGENYASFPDLIIIINKDTCLPIGSNQLTEGQEVVVIVVPKEQLILGTEFDLMAMYEQIQKLTTYSNNMW